MKNWSKKEKKTNDFKEYLFYKIEIVMVYEEEKWWLWMQTAGDDTQTEINNNNKPIWQLCGVPYKYLRFQCV